MDEDFETFWRSLPTMAVMAKNDGLRRQFAKQHRREIVSLLGWLDRLQLAGLPTKLHPAPPAFCDTCEGRIDAYGVFVDGQTEDGSFANMCGKCFMDKGEGIGWGIGQLYRATTEGNWRLVAGNDPDSTD